MALYRLFVSYGVMENASARAIKIYERVKKRREGKGEISNREEKKEGRNKGKKEKKVEENKKIRYE